MNIGIIVHSQTGNTYSVAQKLEEKLKQLGHTVNVERIKTIGDVKSETQNIELDNMPKVEQYDAVVFGGWIQAFRLYPGLEMYINQLPSLDDKKIACFVTMYFPFEWMGGKNGVSKMKELVKAKNADIIESGIINWSRKNKDAKVDALVEKISSHFR